MESNANKPNEQITISAEVLAHLGDTSCPWLPVYIYLCALNKGGDVRVSVSDIEAATHLKDRSVKSALKQLREWNLIIRIEGTGNQANSYQIPLPAPACKPEPPETQAETKIADSLPTGSPTSLKTPNRRAPEISDLEDNYVARLVRATPDVNKLARGEFPWGIRGKSSFNR